MGDYAREYEKFVVSLSREMESEKLVLGDFLVEFNRHISVPIEKLTVPSLGKSVSAVPRAGVGVT